VNLSEIRAAMLRKLREESSTAFDDTELNSWINEAIDAVWGAHLWPFRKKHVTITNVYTLCSGDGDSTGVTLYVDSVAGMRKGLYLWVTDGLNFEKVQILSINGATNVITLEPSGLQHTYTDGDYVSSANIWLPWDCQKVLNIRCLDLDTSNQAANSLKPHPERSFWWAVNYMKSRGKTTDYYKGGKDNTNEGKSSNFAADAGTDTNTIIESSLAGHEDGYYKWWLAINTDGTHMGTARVSDYTYSTTTLELEKAIAGQTNTDTFYLERRLNRIFLYPVPDEQYYYEIEYLACSPQLYNDYDEVDFGEYQQALDNAVVFHATSEAMSCDNNENNQKSYAKFGGKVRTAWLECQMPLDGLINMRPKRRNDLPGLVI